MKFISLLILLSMSYSLDGKNDISFHYGVLGRFYPQEHGMTIQSLVVLNDDTTMVLEDNALIHTNDEVRINAGYGKDTYFYLIFHGSDGGFDLLYPNYNTMVGNMSDEPDTIYTTVLHWTEISDPIGLETFFLINSNIELDNLLNIFKRYEMVNKRGRKKLERKIQKEIDNIDPGKKRGLNSMISRLDNPVIGGLAYRADGKDKLMDISLTHYCRGNSDIAFKKIVLNHK